MPIKDNDIYNPRLKTKQPHPYIKNNANFFYVDGGNASSLQCLKHSYCRRLREHNIEHCIQINNLIKNIISKQINLHCYHSLIFGYT